MKKLSAGPLHYEFNRLHEVRLRIDSGEKVEIETEDAFTGQIRSNDDRRDKLQMPNSNPLTGPIWIEGAQPGDCLAVRIEKIEPLIGQCSTRTAAPGMLTEWLGEDCPHGTHVCPISEGQVHWSDNLKIPYTPMFGCIGTAPANGAPTTIPAGVHGGNLDIRETAPGNTVFLPVFVEGAYLYLGDVHAAMGAGELSAAGLEMPARSLIAVDLLKGRAIPAPRIETPDEILTIATGTPMERAIAQAFAWLILWMESDYGWNRWKAYDILTHVSEISVGYYAIGTVAVKISKSHLNAR